MGRPDLGRHLGVRHQLSLDPPLVLTLDAVEGSNRVRIAGARRSLGQGGFVGQDRLTRGWRRFAAPRASVAGISSSGAFTRADGAGLSWPVADVGPEVPVNRRLPRVGTAGRREWLDDVATAADDPRVRLGYGEAGWSEDGVGVEQAATKAMQISRSRLARTFVLRRPMLELRRPRSGACAATPRTGLVGRPRDRPPGRGVAGREYVPTSRRLECVRHSSDTEVQGARTVAMAASTI